MGTNQDPSRKRGTIKESSEEYHKTKAISAHGLIEIIERSPLHFYENFIKEKEEEKQTPAQRFGELVHLSILEPRVFEETAVVQPKVDLRTKDGKSIFQAWKEKLPDNAIPITEDEQAQILAMKKQLYSNEPVQNILSVGIAEISGYFELEGIYCKFRGDFLREDGIVLEYKTCEDASYKAFQKAISNYRYDIQAAWYFDAYLHVTNRRATDFIWICQEKAEPYAVACYIADSTILDNGRSDYRKAFDLYCQCMKNNQWPGYQQEIQMITLAPWALWKNQ